ncbi:MAG: ribbon-helix-helix domain-containing protein [Nanoarchaeota archaeon]
MVMDTLQIRMNSALIKRIDLLVKSGIYANRADVIRDAVRRFVWEKEVGTINWNGEDSVEQIRKVRKKLSKEKFNLNELNNFGD